MLAWRTVWAEPRGFWKACRNVGGKSGVVQKHSRAPLPSKVQAGEKSTCPEQNTSPQDTPHCASSKERGRRGHSLQLSFGKGPPSQCLCVLVLSGVGGNCGTEASTLHGASPTHPECHSQPGTVDCDLTTGHTFHCSRETREGSVGHSCALSCLAPSRRSSPVWWRPPSLRTITREAQGEGQKARMKRLEACRLFV